MLKFFIEKVFKSRCGLQAKYDMRQASSTGADILHISAKSELKYDRYNFSYEEKSCRMY